MTPKGQERVKRRMQAWAKLTPEQRREARAKYRNLGKLPPEQQQDLRERWAEYQSLSPHEKRVLDAPPAGAGERKRRVKARKAAPAGSAPP